MRTRTDAEFHTFDGLNLPFEDASFDVVYCAQVLEHARHPESLLIDVARVLRPGGALAGSTSQLEPFHSRSTFNFTPHGLSLLLESAGLAGVELRPSVDALTLIVRRGLGGPELFNRWWRRESPLNRAIDVYGALPASIHGRATRSSSCSAARSPFWRAAPRRAGRAALGLGVLPELLAHHAADLADAGAVLERSANRLEQVPLAVARRAKLLEPRRPPRPGRDPT